MVELELLGVSPTEESPEFVVLLRHEGRVLPILVGIQEATAIQLGLMSENERPMRPMTHDLICNLLVGLRGEVKSVTIYKLERDTFYAHLTVEQTSPEGVVEQVLRIDSRPSDGIAIATRVHCPIYASEEVMNAASQSASIIEPGADEPDGDESEDGFDE